MEDLLLWIIVACVVLLAAVVVLWTLKKMSDAAPPVPPPAHLERPAEKPAARVGPPVPEPSLQTTLYALAPQSPALRCPNCDGENRSGATRCRICGETI